MLGSDFHTRVLLKCKKRTKKFYIIEHTRMEKIKVGKKSISATNYGGYYKELSPWLSLEFCG